MAKYIAKPTEVDAFQYGTEKQPSWFLKAVREKKLKVSPSKGHIVAKTAEGRINLYDPLTFMGLFETVSEAKDLDEDGTISPREEAIATEVKRKTPKKRKAKEVEPTEA